MRAIKNIVIATVVFVAGLMAQASFANVPPSLTGPHAHAVEVTGKVTLMRAQMKGLEIGTPEDFLDAEILITLEGQDGKVFGFRFHDDNPEAIAMENMLREAYFRGLPVTIAHKLEPKKNHLTIIWVQVGSYTK